MRTFCKVLAVLWFTMVLPVRAAPGYEYTFETIKSNMQQRVDNVASQGWELFDVAFTNFGGYLACYRRTLPPPKVHPAYTFDLVTAANAQDKANVAAKNGWAIFKMVSCAGRLYCLCYHRVGGPPATYRFETCVGADLGPKTTAAAKQGWELLDVGFGDVSGYLLCYRQDLRNAPRLAYNFSTPNSVQLEATARAGTERGLELMRIVPCTQNLYCLTFRVNPKTHYSYTFERAAGANIEAKADAAVKNGWEVFRVIGDSAGDIDFAEASDAVRSSVAYLICYRR